MMTAPPHFSVEQLLQARQNGVPDYVVVPLLQKTIALKNAAAQQAALQAAPQKPPPIAQQVLGAAQQDQAREAGIAQLMAQEQPKGHAGGGILAFAQGGNTSPLSPEDIAQGEADFAPNEEYSDTTSLGRPAVDANGIAKIRQYADAYREIMGPNEADAKSQQILEARQKEHEENKSKAPWLALMKAGAAMAQSKSPYFMSALGEGLGAGAEELESGQKELSREAAGIQDLDLQIARAKRAEDVAVMQYGYSSAQAEQARAEKAKALAEKERHNRETERIMQFKAEHPYEDMTKYQESLASQGEQRIAISKAKGSGSGSKNTGVNNRAALSATNSDLNKWLNTSDGAMATPGQIEQMKTHLYERNLQLLSGSGGGRSVSMQPSNSSPFKHASKYE